jgi:ABC-type Mn2+/Zn2+ transport system permease subunit
MRQIVRDARDQAFVQLLIQVLILIPASAACLFFLEIRSPHLNSALFGLLAVFHSVIVLYFFAPFTLMLHNISHKNP